MMRASWLRGRALALCALVFALLLVAVDAQASTHDGHSSEDHGSHPHEAEGGHSSHDDTSSADGHTTATHSDAHASDAQHAGHDSTTAAHGSMHGTSATDGHDAPASHETGDAVNCSDVHGDHGHSWTYDAQQCWAAQFPHCGGDYQSPIDIVTSTVTNVGSDSLALKQHYAAVEGLYVQNTGHGLLINPGHLEAFHSDFGYLEVGGLLYHVRQLHWHMPSEHTINGELAAAELHIVHQLHGATGTSNLLVVGVLFNEGPEDPVLRQMGVPGDAPSILHDHRPVFGSMSLPNLMGNFYRYDGSLTTPPCSETVKWFVMENQRTVSAAQMEAFRQIFPFNTHRSTEPLHQRHVKMNNFFAESIEDSCSADNQHNTAASAHSDADAHEGHGEYRHLTDTEGHEGHGSHDSGGHEGGVGDALEESHVMGYDGDFSYRDARCWTLTADTCGDGTRQSPIEINTTGITQIGEDRFLNGVEYTPLPPGLSVVNNGHTIVASTSIENVHGHTASVGHVIVSGKQYNLKFFKLHMPAEHAIDGVLYHGELQLIHQLNGAHGDNDLLIASVMLDIGAENMLLRQLGLPDNIPQAAHGHVLTNSTIETARVAGYALGGNFYRYDGSLTTPPCSETVKWFVFETVSTMSMQQYSAFKDTFPSPSNNRPLQPLFNRQVALNDADFPGPNFEGYGLHPFEQNYIEPSAILIPCALTLALCGALMAITFVSEDSRRKNQASGGLFTTNAQSARDAELYRDLGQVPSSTV